MRTQAVKDFIRNEALFWYSPEDKTETVTDELLALPFCTLFCARSIISPLSNPSRNNESAGHLRLPLQSQRNK